MRLIDADAVPQEFWEYEFDGKWRGCTIKDLLDSQPTVHPEPHWIPVTERPPEESGCYLVSVKNDHKRRYSKTAWFEKDAWLARQDVIAWMPLPEPWKGEVTE